MEEILKSESCFLSNALLNYLSKGFKSIQEFEIDCSKLDSRFLKEDIRHSEEFKHLFENLIRIQKSPCLYIFEVNSETSADLIISKLKDFGAQTQKVIPKLNTKISNSKILYVGKVNNFGWGRLITHLGFHTYKNDGNSRESINHGLHLHYWAKDIGLRVKYTVMEFDTDMKDILPALEKKLAQKLRPIVGTHK